MFWYEFLVKSLQIFKNLSREFKISFCSSTHVTPQFVPGPLLSWVWVWTLTNRRCKWPLFLAPPAGQSSTNDGSTEASSSLFRPMWTVAMAATAIKKKEKKREPRAAAYERKRWPQMRRWNGMPLGFPFKHKRLILQETVLPGFIHRNHVLFLNYGSLSIYHYTSIFCFLIILCLHMTNKVKRDWTMANTETVRNVLDKVRTSLRIRRLTIDETAMLPKLILRIRCHPCQNSS